MGTQSAIGDCGGKYLGGTAGTQLASVSVVNLVSRQVVLLHPGIERYFLGGSAAGKNTNAVKVVMLVSQTGKESSRDFGGNTDK